MFDFIGDIFGSVVNWVTDVAGEAVGAVAGQALKGAVTGAIVGAATAAFKGDDILDGALRGTAYGGVAGGVLSTVGQLSGIESFTAKSQLGKMGVDTTPGSELEGNLVKPGEVSITEDAGARTGYQGSGTEAASTSSASSSAPKSSSYWQTNDGKNALLGIGKGLIGGASDYMETKAKNEQEEKMLDKTVAGNKELLDKKAQIAQDVVNANQPGQFKSQTAKIEAKEGVSDWYANHLPATTPKTQGLIAAT